jgi:integrase
MKLTSQIVDKLTLNPGQTDRIVFDDAVPGFGLRIRAVRKWNGALSNAEPGRTWVYQYRLGGRTRRMNLGQASAVKVQQARDIAAQLHAKVTLGQDPAAEKEQAIAKASDTLGQLIQKYLDRQRTQLRPRSMRAITRYLQNYCGPLQRTPVDSVDRKAVAAVLHNIEQSAGAVSSNRARAALSACFSWAMREGLASANPVIGTSKRAEKSRERILSAAELKLIWNAAPADGYGTIVKLLMLTGARLNEIAGLKWSEVDFQRGIISLSGNRTKNKRPHELPLSPIVRALLKAQPRRAEEVFRTLSEARVKAALDEAIAKANGGKAIPAWVHHDLRRSAATGMAEIGIQPHIIEAVLNHISGHKGGIAGIYNRAQYAAEKAEALARWDRHLSKLTA